MNVRRLGFLLCLVCLLCLLVCPPAFGEDTTLVTVAPDSSKVFQEGGFPSSAAPLRTLATTAVENALYQGLMNEEAEIDLYAYRITPDDLADLLWDLINGHSELFFVESGFRYRYVDSGGVRYAYSILPNYRFTGAERTRRSAEFNAELNRIAAYAAPATTPLGKALLVNDYFCLHYEYDNSYTIYDAYNLFTQKTGVCQAYMLGYRAAMQKLGVDCATVTSDPMNHTWNMVKVGGNWYHVDVTWNDPTLPDLRGRARHEYFLTSDGGLADHHSWDSKYSASSKTYDSAFWKNVDTAIPVSGSALFYVAENTPSASRHTLRRWRDGGATSDLYTFDARWMTSGGGYYSGYFGFVALVKDRLYFAVPKGIYSIGTDGTGAWLEYAPPNLDGNITRGYAVGGKIYYGVTWNVNLSGAWSSWKPSAILPTSISLSVTSAALSLGERATVVPVILPAGAVDALTWTIADPSVAAFDANGAIVALSPGTTLFTAATVNGLTASCEVAVSDITTGLLTLPGGIKDVAEGAFKGAPFRRAILGASLQSVGARAFADCPRLTCVDVDGMDTTFASDAFEGCPYPPLFICRRNSVAHDYAMENGHPVRLID